MQDKVSACAASRIDIGSAAKVLDLLAIRLNDAAGSVRVESTFNYHPESITLDEKEAFHNNPENSLFGKYADFEIVARLAYTARLTHHGIDNLAEAYYLERDGVLPTNAQCQALFESSFVFDILYYFYFLDFGFPGTPAQDRAKYPPQVCSQKAAAICDRLREDQAADRAGTS